MLEKPSMLDSAKARLGRWLGNSRGFGGSGRDHRFVRGIVDILGDVMEPDLTLKFLRTPKGGIIYQYCASIPYPNALGVAEMDKLSQTEGVVSVHARAVERVGSFEMVVTCCEAEDAGALRLRLASDYMVILNKRKDKPAPAIPDGPGKAVVRHITHCVDPVDKEVGLGAAPSKNGGTLVRMRLRVLGPVSLVDMRQLVNPEMIRDAQLQATPGHRDLTLLLKIDQPSS